MNSELFEQNLEVIQKFQPELVERLKAIENSASKLIVTEDDGDFNIDLGHVHFYEDSAKKFTNDQFEKYTKSPKRIQLGWPSTPSENLWKAQNFRIEMLERLEAQGLTEAQQEIGEGGGFAIVLGLGLGFHIKRLFSDLNIRSVYIAEQYLEFVYHALHIHDARDWYEEAKKRNGQFAIIIGDDPSMMTNLIYMQVKHRDFGLIDGSYFYEHYDSFFMKEMNEIFMERIPVLAGNPGFFEDELVMLENCFHNITNFAFQDYTDAKRMVKETPVIIAGSGPSIDKSIDLIKSNRENVILISAGTGLGTLLEYGIKPDFHVDTENTPGPPEIIGGLSKKYDLGGITLIAPNTVHPKVPPFFEKVIFYFRDMVCSTKIFGGNSQEIFNASPTVTNAATRIALGMGFKEFYLVGVDLGAREQGNHHSQKSIYNSDKSFFDTHPQHKTASKFELKARGNLGGDVFTNISFLNAAMFFSSFEDRFPLAKLYNLSDGIRIQGTIPKLPETVSIPAQAHIRNRELKQLNDNYNFHVGKMQIDKTLLLELHEAMKRFYSELRQTVQSTDEENPDIFAFYDAIKPVVYMDRTTGVQQAIHQIHVGTVMMFFHTGFQFFRRLKEEQQKDFFALFKSMFIEYIDALEKDAFSFMDDISKKAASL